ncbi:hypothetical protein [Glutamicibacter arilaitensis]|uniref:hypothetical protein n=1 Tax=Glutamicibacter arilaitensis TaxID=256701 RepID=UPI00384D145A
MELGELILPAAIGAGGTILGVLVTNSHTVRLARLNHNYTRIGAERLRLEETAQVLERWTNNMIAILPFYYRAETSDLIEFVDTDSGKKNREDGERLKNLLTSGKVNSTSPQVQDAYRQLASLWASFTDKSIHTLTLKKNGHTPESSYVDAMEFRENFTKIVDHIGILLNAPEPSWVKKFWLNLREMIRGKFTRNSGGA